MADAGLYQNLGVAIKTIYPNKALEPMINEEAPFREKLGKSVPSGSKFSEGDLKFNGVLALPQNVGQIVDGGDLQDAGERSEVQFNLKPTIFTATMNIGWLTKKVANSNKAAFNMGESKRRTEETVSNLGKFIESTYVGTAGLGIRGYVESNGGASGLVIKQPEGVKLLRQGMKISVRTGGTPVSGTPGTVVDADSDGVRIYSVNPTTRTIKAYLIGTTTPSDFTGAAQDDAIHVVTGANQTLSSLYANGLRGLVDDGTNWRYIHGLDRTTAGYEKLSSIVKSNGGTLRNLTEQLLIRTIHDLRESTGKRPTDMWSGVGQIEKYIEFVAPDRRRAVEGGKYDKSTGYKSNDELVHYAPGVKLVLNTSFDLIPRELYLLSWDTWFHYVAQEMQWVDDDSMLHMGVNSSGGRKAIWESFMSSMENIGCDMPCANAVIRDLKDPSIGDV
jgi:hypothetical protein